MLLEQCTPTGLAIRNFRERWRQAAGKNMAVVEALFIFCTDNEWMAQPGEAAKAIKTKPADTERVPFSDEDLPRMFSLASMSTTRVRSGGRVRFITAYTRLGGKLPIYKWAQEELRDFLQFPSIHGVGIDVCTFHSKRLLPFGQCHIRMTRTGKKIFTCIPEWVQERIRERAKVHRPLIFGTHVRNDTNIITELWRPKLNRRWKLCGQWALKANSASVPRYLCAPARSLKSA